jgi:hypothetical protein
MVIRMFKNLLVPFLCLLFATAGCAIRRIPPVRYLPLLGESTDSSMEGILSVALKDKNPLVRWDAVNLLSTMVSTPEEQKRSAAALGRALNDKVEDIRLDAVRGLENIPNDISGPYLNKAMKDKSVRVRVEVIRVLSDSYSQRASQLRRSTPAGGGQ